MSLSETTSCQQARATWYALYTRHQHEKTVAAALTNKGFDVFLPLYNVTHRWKDRTKQLSLPLFPCYVFLSTKGYEWLSVLTTPGVHMVVGYSGQPAGIPEAEIDAIRRAVQFSNHVEPHPFLKCGDWVRVNSGPLEGIEGILVRKKSQFRLVLSVEMLGKSVSLEVDISTVERTSAANPTLGTKCSIGRLTEASVRTHAAVRGEKHRPIRLGSYLTTSTYDSRLHSTQAGQTQKGSPPANERRALRDAANE
jgi:transcription antitermination factor NusG